MSRRTLFAAVGTAFVAGMTAAPIASAAENPFALSGLSSGYQVADNHAAKQVEGKCGTKKETETKAQDGKCGATKNDAKAAEMKATDKTMPEGKCGEGKCGASKKPMDDKSGAMQ